MIAGVDEFLDEVIVLPPGEWDPKIRIEPPKKVPSAEMRHVNECNIIYKITSYLLPQMDATGFYFKSVC